MPGVNKVILIGNIGQKPELRHTSGGTAVTELRLATTERRKDKDGNWGDATEWHTVVVWNNQAENCAKFLDKGRQVYVEGRLQTRSWSDQQGNKRYKTEIVANTVNFLNAGRESFGGGEQRYSDAPRGPAPGMDDGGGADDAFGEDIPF